MQSFLKFTLLIGVCVLVTFAPIYAYAGSTETVTNVEVEEVSPKKLKIYKTYIGHLKPLNRVVVRSETSGTVEKIIFEEGQKVFKDSVLVHISTNELELQKTIAKTNYDQAVSDYQTQKNLYFESREGIDKSGIKKLEHVSLKQLKLKIMIAKADYDFALSEYNVQKSLFEKKMASATTFDSYKTALEIKLLTLQQAELELEQAQVQDQARLGNYENVMHIREANLKLASLELEKSKIKSPFDGIVKRKIVQMGGYIDKGSDLLEIMDISNVLAYINIPEMEMKYSAPGKEVSVRLDAIPDVEFNGRIKTLGLEADLKCRCFPAEIEIDNAKQELFPGMMVRVEMLVKQDKNQVIVPRHAVLETQRGSIVYVEKNGVALKKSVVVGEMIREEVQIIRGLDFGDRLIVVGQDLLTNNEAVKVVNPDKKIVQKQNKSSHNLN